MDVDIANNLSLQSDEMEALTSIFGNQWQIDSKTGICSIEITKSVKLFITLVPEYPSKSLPNYELLAPELSSSQKQHIHDEFEKLFGNEMGEPLIYQMIMIIEDIAKQEDNSLRSCNLMEHMSNSGGNNALDYKNVDLEVESGKPILKKFNRFKIVHGPIIVDRKSVFQGHACEVKEKEDVRMFMETLLENRKIAQATHNITAYRITLPNNVVLQDCDDDGEHKASGRLLDLLQTLKLNDVMVVVSRWYGGIHLGPDRFRHISNAARQVLVEAGFIKS